MARKNKTGVRHKMSRDEIQALVDTCRDRLKLYPPEGIEAGKIREQIAGLEARLGKGAA